MYLISGISCLITSGLMFFALKILSIIKPLTILTENGQESQSYTTFDIIIFPISFLILALFFLIYHFYNAQKK